MIDAPKQTGWLVALAALSVLATCGGDDGGNAPPPDAMPSACNMYFSLPTEELVAPAAITVDGEIEDNGAFGVHAYSWTVTFDDGGNAEVAFERSDPDGRSITFVADRAGTYRVSLTGDVGQLSCLGTSDSFPVRAPAANQIDYWVRVLPAPGHEAPIQQFMRTIYGGANAELEPLTLTSGLTTDGVVRTQAGDPVAGYVRARTAFGVTTEAFADAGGAFSMLLEATPYDVLVVPDNDAIAPAEFRAQLPPSDLTALELAPGAPLTGTVLDATDAPIAGAQVSARVDGVPTTIGTTDASGGFTVSSRPGTALAVTVVPPAQAGLPTLEFPAALGLTPGAEPLDIRYAAHTGRSGAIAVHGAGQTPLAGARVTWVARPIADAGTIAIGSQNATATGTVRRSGEADGAGVTPTFDLVSGVYDVIIEPAGQVASIVAVDISGGVPASVAVVEPAVVTGVVVDDQQRPIADVDITATPTGLLAGATSTAHTSPTSASGQFTMTLTAGGDYDVSWATRDARYATLWTTVAAPGPGQTAPLDMPPLPRAIEITGEVQIPGVGSASGVSVMLMCYQCEGVEADRPIAQAVTTASGRFTLAVPDPGINTGE